MQFTLLFSQFLSGLTYGMILFLVSSGLSLIFGVMNILNFAHATLWLIGAYFCYSFWSVMQDFSFALDALVHVGTGHVHLPAALCDKPSTG